jgi:2'-5' RNA ligase
MTSITLGVLIPVPEPHAEVLRAWREAVGDPEARRIPPHVTLVAPVTCDVEALPGIECHLADAAVDVPAFRMHLRGTGTFRPLTPVVFVAVADGISGCEELERRVRRGPLDLERAFPYHPHVTVAHGVADADLDRAYAGLADFTAEFTVTTVQLYELAADRWTVRREFPLG